MRKIVKNRELKKIMNEIKYYNKQGDFDATMELIEEADILYPNSDALKFEKAMIYQKQGKLKESVLLFEELIENNRPNMISAMYELLKLCARITNLSDNIDKYVNILIKENYKLNQVYFQYGRYLEKIRNMDGAILNYQKALDLGNDKATTKIENLKIKTNDIQKSDIDIDEVVIEKTETLSELELKIKQLHQYNKVEEIAKLLMLFERKRNNVMIDVEVAYIIKRYLKIGYLDEAKKIFSKYENKILNHEIKELLEALLFVSENKYDKAVEKFKPLTQSDNIEIVFDSYDYLAKIANVNKNYDLEKYYYEKLLEQVPDCDNARFYLACIDYREGKIEEAKEKYSSLTDTFIKIHGIECLQFSALVGLDMSENDREVYSISQYLSYSINRAIYHIKKHSKEYEIEEMSIFNTEIDINELYSDVLLMIANINPTSTFSCADYYIVEYKNVGIFNNCPVNYIEVVTLPNTKKILTMYPIASNNILSRNVINKEKEKEEEKVNIKRKSQIDKFYERYGRIS